MELGILAALVVGYLLIWVYCSLEVSKNTERESEKRQSLFEGMMYDFNHRLSASVTTEKKVKMGARVIIERGTALNKSEEVVIDVPIILARSIKTGAQWQSGSRGVRVSPMKGLSFNLGKTKGQMVQSTEFQQDMGWLTLTNKRLIFKGDSISFSSPLSKVQTVTREDALVFFDLTNREVPDFHGAFFDENVAKLFTLLYSDPNTTVNIT